MTALPNISALLSGTPRINRTQAKQAFAAMAVFCEAYAAVMEAEDELAELPTKHMDAEEVAKDRAFWTKSRVEHLGIAATAMERCPVLWIKMVMGESK